MNDIDFKSFSTRSFERFAQAVAMHVLGEGIMVFGDGPDGGREATFDGTLDYPSAGDKWTGYTVMQAKFLQIPLAPNDDANWLTGQLKVELDKYLAPYSSIRKPEYYVLVTNARLSPMPEGKGKAGGIAKIDAVFKSYQTKLGLKGWRVWHLDQLTTILAGADALRRNYAAWLTSSDIIAKLLDGMDASSKALSQTMYRYLARELRTHQPVRLQQAGHGGDARTMIEDVFSDLPFKVGKRDGEDVSETLLLKHLLDRSRDQLDNKSVGAQGNGSDGRPERVLLLGGPGQGKSTVTQFLAQIFRANMLALDRPDEINFEIKAIVEGTLKKAAAIGLPVALPKRFPVRVDLPAFADSLSKWGDAGGTSNLIGFLAAQITLIAGSTVDIEAVRTWLRDYPNVLILDGLDEVPASANRSDVIRAINEFWDDLVSADTLMIVTTRPQGYNDDLDPAFYTKVEMTPLQPTQAVACAEKLATDRIVDPIHRERVMSRLRDASDSPTTARLMISPLQVAIMLALIDQRGDAPTDRWSLFDKYFAVVLEREQGKLGPVGKAMRHWGRQIVALHHKAGFLLHVEAETQGNAEAHLTSAEFATLIRGQLAEEGFEDDELDSTTLELVSVSTERLVLLVQREEERFTFEVRSLQEFMAAAHLMTGREAIVQRRLYTIANRTHWLHVFQIAASKCFAVPDAEQYRDTLITLCNDLNTNGEPTDQLLRSGSRLALALLDDGLAYDAPKYRRLLFSLALELIESGPAVMLPSLCDHCDREPTRTIQKLQPYFASSLELRVRGAWRLVMLCAAQEQKWAEAFITEIWPTETARIAEPLQEPVEPRQHTLLFDLVGEKIAASTPNGVRAAILRSWQGHSNRIFMMREFPVLKLLLGNGDTDYRVSVILRGRETPLSLNICPLEVLPWQKEAYARLPENANWAAMHRLREFHFAPGAAALADLLEAAFENDWLNLFDKIRMNLPWPVASLIDLCINDDSSVEVIAAVRAGAFGDLAEWLKAEERWSETGVSEDDLALTADGIFFDSRVADVGLPWAGLNVRHEASKRDDWVDDLACHSVEAKGCPRRWMIGTVQFVLSIYPLATPLALETALALLSPVRGMRGKERLDPAVLRVFSTDLLDNPIILERLAELGANDQYFVSSEDDYDREFFGILGDALADRPHLLVLLMLMISAEQRADHFQAISLDQARSALTEPSPIVAGFARVMLLALAAGDEALALDILRVEDSKPEGLLIEVLKQFLQHRWITEPNKRIMGDLIAKVMNANATLVRSDFMPPIQAIANTRVSALQETQCWSDLELGTFLLALMQSRRSR